MGVRRAARPDLERAAALWKELLDHHAALDPHYRLGRGAAEQLRHQLQRGLADADTAVFVWDEADALLGFCLARVTPAPAALAERARAEITELGVAAGARRRGIGRALAEAALRWLEGRGVDRVEVRVAADNPEGQGFWRALGYRDFVDVLQRRL